MDTTRKNLIDMCEGSMDKAELTECVANYFTSLSSLDNKKAQEFFDHVRTYASGNQKNIA